jgi:CubicO group peptidase (beta-lactamase class C family)
MRVGTVIVSLGIALLPHLSQAQTDCGRPIASNDGWPVAAPETVGLAPATLCPTVKWLKNSKEKNVHAVLVARHGKLVFEAYSSGNDEHWGQAVGDVAFGPETKHDVRSATKSVVGLAFGIAIDRGLIKSVDEPVLSFFPEYADLRTPEKDKITLRHLLTMSAGLEWHETGLAALDPANSQLRMDDAADPYRFVLEQKVVSPPGRTWNYSSGSTEVLAAALKKATGKPLDEWMRMTLFEPLGTTDVVWHRYAQGSPIAAGGLRLRPRDLAKIGQLVLQRGTWSGNQLVSASWVEAATAPQINDPSAPPYGYYFWLDRAPVGKQEVNWAIAIGWGGQRLYIAPELDLVVVVNTGLYKSDLMSAVPLAILKEFVLKALEPRP